MKIILNNKKITFDNVNITTHQKGNNIKVELGLTARGKVINELGFEKAVANEVSPTLYEKIYLKVIELGNQNTPVSSDKLLSEISRLL